LAKEPKIDRNESMSQTLDCSDVVFSLINYVLDRTEPYVHGFTGESKSLNADIVKRRKNERTEVIGRAYIARETAIDLQTEIRNKLEFMIELNKLQDECRLNQYEDSSKRRYLIRRL